MGCPLKHVCRRSIGVGGVPRFAAFQAAVSSIVDRHKQEVWAGKLVLLLWSWPQQPPEVAKSAWLFRGWAHFNLKVQLYVRCYPETENGVADRYDDDGPIEATLPRAPFSF